MLQIEQLLKHFLVFVWHLGSTVPTGIYFVNGVIEFTNTDTVRELRRT